MATILLQRTSEYNNRLRDYKIFIDGEQAVTIGNGDTKTIEVPAGKHSIVAKIDWCSSPEREFHVNENETVYFNTGGYRGAKWVTRAVLVLLVLHFLLQRTINFHYTIYFAMVPFLLILYYITIGRKNYLQLEQTSSLF